MNLNLQPVDRLTVPHGREIPGLQALKLLCALLVVIIHTEACQDSSLFGLTRVAVPIFFMVTGFFLVDPRGLLQSDRLKRTVVKLAWITLWAQLLYMAFYAVTSLAEGQVPYKLWNPFEWLKAVAFGANFGGHLWYLNSCLQALIIIWIAVSCGFERMLVWFIPVGLAMAILLGSYAPAIGVGKLHLMVYRGPVSAALPWIMAGVVLRRLGRMPRRSTLLVLAAVFAVGVWVEFNHIIPVRRDMLVAVVPLSVVLFMLFVGLNPQAMLVVAGRNYATGIYIMHIAVMHLFRPVSWLYSSVLLAPATFVASLLLLMAWRRMPGRSRIMAAARL